MPLAHHVGEVGREGLDFDTPSHATPTARTSGGEGRTRFLSAGRASTSIMSNMSAGSSNWRDGVRLVRMLTTNDDLSFNDGTLQIPCLPQAQTTGVLADGC
jgi:hypothetical protein